MTDDIYHHDDHRLLRSLQQQPFNSGNDREAGFVSVGLLTGVIFLGLSMFVCNVLVAKFCPGRGSFANSATATTNNEDAAANIGIYGLAYSSEVRRSCLEATLKSEGFLPFTTSNTSTVTPLQAIDIEKGFVSNRDDVNVDSKVPAAGNGEIDDKLNYTSAVDSDSLDDDNTIFVLPENVVEHNDSNDDTMDDDDAVPQCLICFETFRDGDEVTTHCTNKSYHRHCIMEWLMKHDNCPYCRSPFFASTTALINNNSLHNSAFVVPASTTAAGQPTCANETMTR